MVLTVKNELGGNTLPSTGGSGTMPFAVGGLGIATLGLLGFEMSRKRKRED
jgi:LPXTG-motif cell wall-anchored protein